MMISTPIRHKYEIENVGQQREKGGWALAEMVG
jgi:hypothetical protein